MVLILLCLSTFHHIICLDIVLHLDGNLLVHHHCINHICLHWCNGTSSSKFRTSFHKKRRNCSPFNLCDRKCGSVRQSPSIPIQTLNEKDCWCSACFTSLGLTAAHMWQLWKLKMLSQVNPASSVNKTLFKKWQSRALCYFCWQKVNLGRKSCVLETLNTLDMVWVL